MCTRYVAVLLLATLLQSVLGSLARTKNELTHFGEILASIRTNAWVDVRIDGGGENVSACLNDVATVWEKAAAGNKWALHMLDAESKFQSGILLGNLRNLGMYDQCVEIVAQLNPTNIRSQYCMVSLSIPPDMFSDASSLILTNKMSILGHCEGSTLSLTSAMCLPSSCSDENISFIVSEMIKRKKELNASEIKVTQVMCSDPADSRFTLGGNIVELIVGFIIIFLLCCTVCDLVNRRKGDGTSSTMKTLAKFSLYTNAVCILSTKETPGTIPALNGLRILYMMYIIIVHRFASSVFSPIVNLTSLFESQFKWDAVFGFMMTFVIDNFLIISGFLSTHNVLCSMRSGKKFDLIQACISRYMRLTPAVVFVILICIFYLDRLGSGPIWGLTSSYAVNHCKDSWWANVLYIQNIVKTERSCLPHLWQLAAEMQLFVVSQIILYALFRWPKHQKSIIGCVVTGSLVAPPVLCKINGYTNAFFKITADMSLLKYQENLVYGYMSTVQRSFPYLAGAVLGYITVNGKIQVTKFQAVVCWAVSCSFMLICVLATRYVYLESYQYDAVFEIAYSALARPAWSIATMWIIYACTHGYGGLLGEFLSAPVFTPLSRISYGVYLIHFPLQTSMGVASRAPIIYSKFAILHQAWGDLLVSSFLGFLLNIFVETPMRILERTLRNSSTVQAASTRKSPGITLERNTDRISKKIT